MPVRDVRLSSDQQNMVTSSYFAVRLDLDSNVIEGTIPSELARLVNLVIFSLGQNHLAGTIPSELGNFGKVGEYKTNMMLGWSVFLHHISHPSLHDIQSSASLVLEENKLQGSVPSQLGRMVSLGTSLLPFDLLTIKTHY